MWVLGERGGGGRGRNKRLGLLYDESLASNNLKLLNFHWINLFVNLNLWMGAPLTSFI